VSTSEEKASYRQIMKATSIFGGVQVFNIAIAIVRSKAIALLLGPAGMGIVGLLTSTTGLISSITNFGLGTSAVRDIAEAHAENNEERMGKTTAVFRKLVWLTGALGALLCLVLSPWLSQLTFGNSDYTWSFVFLSISLLIGQLTAGQNVLLQGTRSLKYLAFANMLGSVASVFVALPLYYFYGEDGIVPAIVIMALVTFVIAANFSSKLNIKKVKISFSESLKQGSGMLKLGIMLSLSAIVASIVAYIVRIYIGNTGSIKDVGLYNAGFQIIGTYVGLVFTAMGTDYYPRLSSVANDDKQANRLVNHQSEIAILIIGPIVLFFILFINWVVIALYSNKFVEINEMMRWAALGMFFKAASWPIGYIFLAKGDSQLFFKSELLAHSYTLFLNILGYHFFGLLGLGVSFSVSYFLVYVQVYLLAYNKYGFNHSKVYLKLFVIQFVLSAVVFCLMQLNTYAISTYIVCFLGALISLLHALKEIDKRIHIFKNKI
jgi:O-antigen/teichoic acid export membrane protein